MKKHRCVWQLFLGSDETKQVGKEERKERRPSLGHKEGREHEAQRVKKIQREEEDAESLLVEKRTEMERWLR